MHQQKKEAGDISSVSEEHSGESSDASSTDEEVNEKLKNLSNTETESSHQTGKVVLQTAFRAKIYELSGPIGLVELNEDFN